MPGHARQYQPSDTLANIHSYFLHPLLYTLLLLKSYTAVTITPKGCGKNTFPAQREAFVSERVFILRGAEEVELNVNP